MSRISDTLANLGNYMGLERVGLGDSGACRLIFDDQVNVDLEPHPADEDALLMHTVLGVVPPEEKKTFFSKLLAANYLKRETGGAVLSVDPVTSEVVLWTQADVQALDVVGLGDELTDLVRAAREWAERLETIGQEGDGEVGDGDMSSAAFLRV